MSLLKLPNGIGLEHIQAETLGERDVFLKQFCQEKIKLEGVRFSPFRAKTRQESLSAKGARTIPMAVKNFSQILEIIPPPSSGPQTTQQKPNITIVNRMELDTSFDFEKIQQVMVSEAQPIPERDGFKFCSVLLFTDKPVPLLVPYVFLECISLDDSTGRKGEKIKNPLDTWLLVNNKFQSTRHHVAAFEPVYLEPA